jgi:hypothetical protein
MEATPIPFAITFPLAVTVATRLLVLFHVGSSHGPFEPSELGGIAD